MLIDIKKKLYMCYCNNCKARIGLFDSEEEAVEAWNMRVNEK